jgi:zinc/manganese transport system permease protein
MLAAGGLGTAATWLGILLSYDSFYWPPAKKGWPVSFFVVTIIFIFYLASDAWSWSQTRRTVASDRPSDRIEHPAPIGGVT